MAPPNHRMAWHSLSQCGAPTMHETAWEVFHPTLSRRQAFCEQGEPATYPDQETIFGACMNYPSLFSPLKIGPYQLNHRLVMAPLTRMRAEKPRSRAPAAERDIIAQRATPGGLIIAEASPVMATGFGSPGVPGIYSEHQIKGWREVRRCCSRQGRNYFLQLWHCRAGFAFLVPARRVLRWRHRRCRFRPTSRP